MRPPVSSSVAVAIVAALSMSPAAADDPFGTTRIWSIQIEIPADEYQALQPAPGPGFFGGPGAPPQPPPADADAQRETVSNLFGVAFPWAHAAISIDGESRGKVGIRYDGDGTWFAAAASLKRSFQIDLDRFGEQPLRGLRLINLHSGALDPSKAREAIACRVFRDAGVPASRTALAEVTLTVPGRYDRELLGLYTVIEPVDAALVADRFGADKGLLLKPNRMRGIDYLGDEWPRYVGHYRPQSDATPEQARRVIELARLIRQGSDEEFAAQIDSLLDVDEFLRFLAAHALLSNVDGFFAFGQNYNLFLHPATNRFVFIPGDLELALANFLMMGTPDQLMDLSLTHPYPGDSRLTERLLAIDAYEARYRQVLKELTATVVTRERLRADAAAIDGATRDLRAREQQAAAARREPPGFGFGPPGGAFPPPPDLQTFAEKRLASVEAQLAGTSQGYIPQFNFGPPPPGGSGRRQDDQPVDDTTIRELVTAPEGFDVTLFAAPPDVGYPVAIAAAPTGEVFIAVDEQGSLGRTPGGGKLLRCLDTDGDGKADQFNVFAKMDHPRGVIYQQGMAWVMHPPTLSVYFDDDGDGTADREEVLVTGLTTELIDTRGGDHTTNGIRMGIDGWIYIGVGDYGILKAEGKDGATVTQRGGGILRVRPDGTELEVFATGLRNPFDIAIDPWLNLYTRDNTNDGAGWDVRVSHLVQSAQYGYTQLYASFPDEVMPPLGSFGGGGGTAALYIDDPHWPDGYRDRLFTGDWGRSEVYRHELRDHAPTFDMATDVFVKIPRATGMDIDGSGRLYVASWRGGEASVFVGPQVGFIARVTPHDLKSAAVPSLKDAGLPQLLELLAAPNAVWRLHAQREILRRGRDADASRALLKLTSDQSVRTPGRIAALFALKQLDGADSHAALLTLADDPKLCEFALKALTDRKSELAGLDSQPLVAALADDNLFTRAQALISLGRLGDASAAEQIIPLTSRPEGSTMPTQPPIHAQPDPDRVIPHLAVRALVALNAVDACLAAIDGPHHAGALRALRSMHDQHAVEGLIRRLSTAYASELRRDILSTLIRLYHKEADYDGSWWGIRPDSTGPYYDGRPWEASPRIEAVIRSALIDGDEQTAQFLLAELARHQVRLSRLPAASGLATQHDDTDKPLVIVKADSNNPDQIGNLSDEVAAERTLSLTGDPVKGKALFVSQSCRSCHTDADGQTPRGPHLVDIGKRYTPEQLVESILRPSAKFAQGYETYTFAMTDGRVLTGFVVSERAGAVLIRETTGVPRELKRDEIEGRKRQEQSAMPPGIVGNLTAVELADLLAYLQEL